jgi:tyrosine-protein kinase Etk/Wzc
MAINANPSNDEVRLVDYFVILAKYSRMIIYLTIVVSLLTYIFLLIVPQKYTATASFIPPFQNATLSGQLLDGLTGATVPGMPSMGGLGSMAAGLLGLQSPSDMYVGILNGNTIADRIIERFDLKTLYRKKYIEYARKQLAGRATIKADKSGLITIMVTDESPQRAADMANAYMEELGRLLQEITEREATSRLAFLEKKHSLAAVNLVKAEEALRDFSEESGVLQIDAQARGMIEYIASLRAMIDYKEVELQVLHKKATPSNYEVIQLETELKGLKEKLHVAEAQDSGNPGLGGVMIATGKVPALGLEYLRLFREAKFHQGIYYLYGKLVELAHIDQTREATVIQIVDWGIPPESKSHPQRLVLTILISGITFVLLVMVAFFREFWHTKGQTESEAIKFTQISEYFDLLKNDFRRLQSLVKRVKR